jgi:hypothetical protein
MLIVIEIPEAYMNYSVLGTSIFISDIYILYWNTLAYFSRLELSVWPESLPYTPAPILLFVLEPSVHQIIPPSYRVETRLSFTPLRESHGNRFVTDMSRYHSFSLYL